MSAKSRFEKVEPGLLRHTSTGVFYVRKTFRHLRIPDLFESLRETKISAARREAQRRIESHKTRYLGGALETDRRLACGHADRRNHRGDEGHGHAEAPQGYPGESAHVLGRAQEALGLDGREPP
jgi:hypothetical protein